MNDMRKLMEHVNGISYKDFLREYSESENVADELEELQGQMLDLLGAAESLLHGTSEYDSAKAYWLAHVETALSNDHGYLGGSMTTMQDTIDALREAGEEDWDDEEEDWDEPDDPEHENIPGENDPLKEDLGNDELVAALANHIKAKAQGDEVADLDRDTMTWMVEDLLDAVVDYAEKNGL